MERAACIEEAETLFKNNFLGVEVLKKHSDEIGICVPEIVPEIPFTLSELSKKAKDYILILGALQMIDGKPVTLMSLRNHFGVNPNKSEPCFYNQDWYMKEEFMNKPLECKWHLIRKYIFDATRSQHPELLVNTYPFPSAVLCAFAFFANWFHSSECLWKHDFVWCNEVDHNKDRIYVGKYEDIDGLNKNGFSIHRHLTIKEWYGSV